MLELSPPLLLVKGSVSLELELVEGVAVLELVPVDAGVEPLPPLEAVAADVLPVFLEVVFWVGVVVLEPVDEPVEPEELVVPQVAPL